jgi:hypothetical protein
MFANRRRGVRAAGRSQTTLAACRSLLGVAGIAALGGTMAAAGCSSIPAAPAGGSPASGSFGPTSGDDASSAFYGDDEGGPVLGFGSPFGSVLQPTFGAVTVASKPPPAISGGTLLVTRDGAYAVAADPDRDVIYVVDLAKNAVASVVTLSAGDEPGRLAEDGAGRVHVALRGGGALLTIDVTTGAILERRPVCPAPRGVAWDSAADAVWVACATGELVSLPAAGGSATTTQVIERDLRDVLVNGGSISVSQFRSAQVLNLDGSGSVTRRDQLPSPLPAFVPQVVWRAIAGPSGTVVAVHQTESTQSIVTQVTGGYGGSGCDVDAGVLLGPTAGLNGDAGGSGGSFAACGNPNGPQGTVDAGTDVGMLTTGDADLDPSNGDASTPVVLDVPINTPPPPPPPPGGGPLPTCVAPVVASVLTVLGPDGTALVNKSFSGTLPVDVAISGDGTLVAAVAPGNAFSANALDGLFIFSSCGSSIVTSVIASGTSPSVQLTAVAFDSANDVVVQSREPAFLAIVQANGKVASTIPLSSDTRDDTGHDVFHTQAGALIACASCHPEGRDDGHVWKLDGDLRRTPSLRGTIAGTAPYHWPGDEANLDVLVNDVYTIRMGGVMLATPMMNALTGWVQTVPALPAPAWVDSAAAGRGQALFERNDVGCSGCHSGPKFTNNTTVDVGTGGAFQVPPLVGVGWRTPLFHDGCAATMADRFGSCATPQHGSIAGLSSQNVSDLIAYLESL